MLIASVFCTCNESAIFAKNKKTKPSISAKKKVIKNHLNKKTKKQKAKPSKKAVKPQENLGDLENHALYRALSKDTKRKVKDTYISVKTSINRAGAQFIEDNLKAADGSVSSYKIGIGYSGKNSNFGAGIPIEIGYYNKMKNDVFWSAGLEYVEQPIDTGTLLDYSAKNRDLSMFLSIGKSFNAGSFNPYVGIKADYHLNFLTNANPIVGYTDGTYTYFDQYSFRPLNSFGFTPYLGTTFQIGKNMNVDLAFEYQVQALTVDGTYTSNIYDDTDTLISSSDGAFSKANFQNNRSVLKASVIF